jgi:hypothetical protein
MKDSSTRANVTISRPVVTTTLVPANSTIRADSGAVTIITMANGISRTPACSGV